MSKNSYALLGVYVVVILCHSSVKFTVLPPPSAISIIADPVQLTVLTHTEPVFGTPELPEYAPHLPPPPAAFAK